MANYYFLATLLPPLKVGSPPEIGSKELDDLMRQNLSSYDFESIVVLRRLVDIENMRALWLKLPFQPGGNFDAHGLEEAMGLEQNLPQYVLDFLAEYPEISDRLRRFPELLNSYFIEERKKQKGFLKEYLTFEWQWRLVFVALRAKELNRDLTEELRYEDPEDPFISQILAQNQDLSFDPPAPYWGLKALFESRKHAPLDLYQALSEWRFGWIEEIIEWEYFSFTRILGYVTQLDICEKWLELDKRKGLAILEEMIKT